MAKNSRRNFLIRTLAVGLGAWGTTTRAETIARLSPTPQEVEGPFYPITPQKDKDFDLTRVIGQSGVAKGKIIWVEGVVVDTFGHPLEGATVDLWQANAVGRYRHPEETNEAPLDPNFQGWAIVPSGVDGRFRFKTIMPGSYPFDEKSFRAPHIHFKVGKPGYAELATQMYFPYHPLNEGDSLLSQKSPQERALMVAELSPKTPETYRYRIVLQKI